jgi:hypothetical protein
MAKKKASKREIDTRLTIRMRRSDELLKWDGDQEFVKEYLKRLGDFGIAQAWAELLHQSVRHRLELAEHIIEGMPHTHSLSAKASRLRDLIRNFLFPAVRIGHLSGAMLWMSQLENSGSTPCRSRTVPMQRNSNGCSLGCKRDNKRDLWKPKRMRRKCEPSYSQSGRNIQTETLPGSETHWSSKAFTNLGR